MNEAPSRARAINRDQAAALMQPLTDLVVQAGLAILAVSRRAMKVEDKSDGSPVTEADLAADRIIGDGLARLIPDVPALSEERVEQSKPPYRGSFFLIDPLDGTKEFVAGRAEFTVNLALVTNGTPLLGVIGAPALGWLWRGLVGHGAERVKLTGAGTGAAEPIRTRPAPASGEPWIAAVSRSHGGRNRHLPTSGAHIGMGCCGRPRRRDRRWRPGYRRPWRASALRRGTRWLYCSSLHRLGRSRRGSRRTLLSQALLQLRPARTRPLQERPGIGGKSIAVGFQAKQIEPFVRDHPEPGIAGKGDAARDIDRVVAAELGTVNLRMSDERCAIALVVKPPDRSRLRGFEVRRSRYRTAVDEIGDGVESLDRKSAETVDDHPFGGGGTGRESWRAKNCP